MFDFFRRYNKLMMVLMFLLIIPSFVMFGVQRYNQFEHADEKVASVDGVAITRTEWETQQRAAVDRIRQQAPSIDVALLDTDAMRYATLERMVRERVLAVAANKDHLSVSDQQLAQVFAAEPALASFRRPDGSFDRELFQRATGRTPEQYEASVRSDLATQQVMLGVAGSAFAPHALADVALGVLNDRREIQLVRFNPGDFAAKVQVSDADADAWYKDHTAQFQQPEQVNVEYLVLDMDAVKKTIPINEADLRSYYEQNKDRLGTKEERRARHILIAVPSGAPAAERAKAKAKAEALLAELKKSPDSFAELARKNSDDELSAKNGGLLDMGPRGSFGAKSLEDTVFSLTKGQTSGVIESEFGYHIVRLDDIKPAQTPSFEQVRATLEDDFRKQQAAQAFAKAAESFTDMVYQQADSLKPAADQFKLGIQTATGVTRQPASGATGVLANRNFLAALFAPDSLERKHNTEAIEIGANQLVSGRVAQYSPARTLPFADVKDKVRAQLVAERAAALARNEGSAKLAAWQTNAAGANFGAPQTVSRNAAQQQPAPVVEAALRADGAKLPALAGVDLGAQGYVVLRVNKDLPRTPPAGAMAAQEQAQVAQAVGAAESAAYYELLKERFKVEILVPRPAQAPLTAALR